MPMRLMNFVSEEQLKETRRTRGVRVEDGTAQRDRSLYEILQENKDKKDAEFNERFKHRPPKALDEDETEFLDKWEMSKKEYERQLEDEEKLQLESFQAAVAAQYTAVQELKEAPSVSKVQEKKPVLGRRNTAARPLGMVVKVNPQTKKAKLDSADAEEASTVVRSCNTDTKGTARNQDGDIDESRLVSSSSGLVSYSSDESEEY
ncbi:hypothetical protein F511_06499 [Dorcoceras hygrometricum]|uniref:FAM192A/Fyv6 N-terminal domain-containing protein n=1 Tax=Dorcoceras hygrometricum TaxID=472368 RepID=A0A2Z7D3N9_9LAMI|nr:hypothetical protein F511_06499 [Dorcoceras hygrometricum]